MRIHPTKLEKIKQTRVRSNIDTVRVVYAIAFNLPRLV